MSHRIDADLEVTGGFGLAGTMSSGSVPAARVDSGTLAVARSWAYTGGDVTAAAGSAVLTIAAAAVTNAKLANMAQATFKGRAAAAGTGAPVDLTAAQAKTALAITTSDVTGLGTMSTQNASAVAITGGTIAGATVAARSVIVSATGAQNPVAYLEHSNTSFTGDVLQTFAPNSTSSANNAWQHFDSVGTPTIVFRGDGRVTLAGSLVLSTIGAGINLRRGTNARSGVSTLVGGTVTVSNTSVTANTIILATHQTLGGTAGFLRTTKIAGTSFTVTSSSATDTSTVGWLLIESTP